MDSVQKHQFTTSHQQQFSGPPLNQIRRITPQCQIQFTPKLTYNRADLLTESVQLQVQLKPSLVNYLNGVTEQLQARNIRPSKVNQWKRTLVGIKHAIDYKLTQSRVFLNAEGKQQYAKLESLMQYTKQMLAPKPGIRDSQGNRKYSKRPSIDASVNSWNQALGFYVKTKPCYGAVLRESTKEYFDGLQARIEASLAQGNLEPAIDLIQEYINIYRSICQQFKSSSKKITRLLDKDLIKIKRETKKYERILAGASILFSRKISGRVTQELASSSKEDTLGDLEGLATLVEEQEKVAADHETKVSDGGLEAKHADKMSNLKASIRQVMPGYLPLYRRLQRVSLAQRFADIESDILNQNHKEDQTLSHHDDRVQMLIQSLSQDNLPKTMSSPNKLQRRGSTCALSSPNVLANEETLSKQELTSIKAVVYMLAELLNISPDGKHSQMYRDILKQTIFFGLKIPELMHAFDEVLFDGHSAYSLMSDYTLLAPESDYRRVVQKCFIQGKKEETIEGWKATVEALIADAAKSKNPVLLKGIMLDLLRLDRYLSLLVLPQSKQERLENTFESLGLDAELENEQLRLGRRVVWRNVDPKILESGRITIHGETLSHVRTIGEGGFGKVSRAISVPTKQPTANLANTRDIDRERQTKPGNRSKASQKVYALKTQRSIRKSSRHNVAKREFLIQSKLSDLRVAKVYDLLLAPNGKSMIRMEKLPGDICDYANRGMNAEFVYHLLLQKIDTVIKGHERGLFWADIKLENSMFDAQENFVMIDLGISRYRWELRDGDGFGTMLYLNLRLPFDEEHTEDLDAYAIAVSILAYIQGPKYLMAYIADYYDSSSLARYADESMALRMGIERNLDMLMHSYRYSIYRPLLQIVKDIMHHGKRLSELDLSDAKRVYESLSIH